MIEAKRKNLSAPMKRYETFDHTADIGIRAFGRTPEEVFIHAAEALFSLLTDLNSVRGEITRAVEIRGSDLEDLLVRWLGELLYLWEGEGYLFREFSIGQLAPPLLRAEARGERFDPARHEIRTEIKAVTYHQAEVSQAGGSWAAKVILDL
jgi:SHS2 domain-containing protein